MEVERRQKNFSSKLPVPHNTHIQIQIYSMAPIGPNSRRFGFSLNSQSRMDDYLTLSPSHLPFNSAVILISGVSGFLGIYCVKEALERGHRVRGTVRSSEKGEYVKQLFEKKHPGKFEYVIAEDLEAVSGPTVE